MGVATSTRRTYQSGLNAFNTFCRQFGIVPFPASSLTLEYFCAQVLQHISYKTLKVYLSGIRLAHIEQGLPDPTDTISLHLVCRGIRHQQGDHQRIRLSITINLLRLLKQQLQICTHYNPVEQCMLWALFTLAFYGFFRASELLSNLRWSGLTLSSNQISIILHQSKTDPFRRGQTVHVFANHSSTCPVRAMTCYHNLVRHTDAADQVFKVGRFQPLAPNTVNEVLCYLLQQGGINQANYASHSFRIGAATTAAAAGIPAWLIKTLGRWSSNAYMTYIRCPVQSSRQFHGYCLTQMLLTSHHGTLTVITYNRTHYIQQVH